MHEECYEMIFIFMKMTERIGRTILSKDQTQFVPTGLQITRSTYLLFIFFQYSSGKQVSHYCIIVLIHSLISCLTRASPGTSVLCSVLLSGNKLSRFKPLSTMPFSLVVSVTRSGWRGVIRTPPAQVSGAGALPEQRRGGRSGWDSTLDFFFLQVLRLTTKVLKCSIYFLYLGISIKL